MSASAKSSVRLIAGGIALFAAVLGVAEDAPRERHWSLLPLVRPGAPAVRDERWPRDAIDRFVLAKLEARSWAPSPSAHRAVLARSRAL